MWSLARVRQYRLTRKRQLFQTTKMTSLSFMENIEFISNDILFDLFTRRRIFIESSTPRFFRSSKTTRYGKLLVLYFKRNSANSRGNGGIVSHIFCI